MRKYFLLIYLLIPTSFLFAQKVKVENNIENIGNGYNAAFKVTLPYTDLKSATKKWTTFLKDNHGKVKTSKSGIKAQNMVINGMSSDSITVYSRITEMDSSCLLIAAFQKKGTFIGPETDAPNTEVLTKLLNDIGKKLALEGIETRSKIATSILNLKLKEKSELTKANQSRVSDNEKRRKEILKNETAISNDSLRVEVLKKEITSQKSLLEAIKLKTKEIE